MSYKTQVTLDKITRCGFALIDKTAIDTESGPASKELVKRSRRTDGKKACRRQGSNRKA